MQRTYIKDLKKNIGKEVKIKGFLQTIRDQKNIKFFILRDVSGTVQVVVEKKLDKVFNTNVNLESVVEIRGLVKSEKQAPDGFEISAKEIIVLSLSNPELPIPVIEKGQQQEADQFVRLDWRHIDLRKEKNLLIFKVWTTFEQALRDYWIKNNYIEIHSPKLIAAASESGAEVFEVKYFKHKAYLAQSPQFYKQMAMASGFEKVFEIGPVFRAEPSFTSRHATEFTGYDTEISYIQSHYDVMAEKEEVLKHAIEKVKKNHGKEIKDTFGKEIIIPSLPFPRVTMEEAKKILSEIGVNNQKGNDMSPEEEKKICEYFKKKENHEFLFVTDYPSSIRPFYHMRSEKNSKITKSFDLLWDGLEVTTGSQREHRYDILVAQAKEKKIKLKSIEFYLNFFKYGCPPHGGYGAGLNRMLMKLLGLENLREAMFIYRGVNRLLP